MMTVEEAKEHLKEEIQPDGGLSNIGWYLWWSKGDPKVTLDGDFTATDLDAILTYIRNVETSA